MAPRPKPKPKPKQEKPTPMEKPQGALVKVEYNKPPSTEMEARKLVYSKKVEEQLLDTLPAKANLKTFQRHYLQLVTGNPKLLECSRMSLIKTLMECASYNLPPTGALGLAYAVPYWNSKLGCFESQLQISYKGLMTMARRGKEVLSFGAEVVYAGDVFEYEKGLTPKLRHVPVHDVTKRGEIVYTYAVAQMANGIPQFIVLSKGEVDSYRGRSKSKGDGPWVTDYGWMAKKTAIRQLCKLLPLSVEDQEAISVDQAREEGRMQGDQIIDLKAQSAEVNDAATDRMADELESTPVEDPIEVHAEEPVPTEPPEEGQSELVDPETGEVIE